MRALIALAELIMAFSCHKTPASCHQPQQHQRPAIFRLLLWEIWRWCPAQHPKKCQVDPCGFQPSETQQGACPTILWDLNKLRIVELKLPVRAKQGQSPVAARKEGCETYPESLCGMMLVPLKQAFQQLHHNTVILRVRTLSWQGSRASPCMLLQGTFVETLHARRLNNKHTRMGCVRTKPYA